MAELLDLQRRIDSFEDSPGPPYYTDEGRLWVPYTGHRSNMPPAKHPKRCHSPRKGLDVRCTAWAVRGRPYCRFHGGRLALGRSQVPGGALLSRYKRSLMPSLAERLMENLSEPRAEQLELYEEIALARTFLDEALRVHALLSSAAGIDADMKITAMSHVQGAMSHVADLVAKMAKIEQSIGDKITVKQVGFVVEQMARVVQKHLGDDPRVDAIAADLRTKVLLPTDEDLDPCVEIEVTY